MIYENEDDVGYYSAPPRSLTICNSILSSSERANIEWAAAFADAFEHHEAALCRARAGYGGC